MKKESRDATSLKFMSFQEFSPYRLMLGGWEHREDQSQARSDRREDINGQYIASINDESSNC